MLQIEYCDTRQGIHSKCYLVAWPKTRIPLVCQPHGQWALPRIGSPVPSPSQRLKLWPSGVTGLPQSALLLVLPASITLLRNETIIRGAW